MAVYTEVSTEQASQLLATLGLGELLALQPVASGIENTNYFVSSNHGDWVLTLFERLRADQLGYYLALMQHLARQELPVPGPQADAAGRLLHQVAGKPAALVNRLPGFSLELPNAHHVQQLGRTLAQMHHAVASFTEVQPNLRGAAWREATAHTVRRLLSPDDAALLDQEMQHQQQMWPQAQALPHGAVHADLFRDNVLFDGLPGRERVSGVFDFYFAGHDSLAYDLAVVLNDWCIDLHSGQLLTDRAEVLLAAYQSQRPLTGAELRLLPSLRRAAALRFWLSRLADWHGPRDARLLTPKDPQHFQRVLRDCVERPWHP